MIYYKKNVERILEDLRQSRMIILTDHPNRENEGDLVFPAEIINPEIVNFMIRNGSGIVCLSLTTAYLKKLSLSLMVPQNNNKAQRNTAFTVSIDAKVGITTGVSAADRARTILAAVNASATEEDIVSPGHIFPLEAKDGGVFEREGHTEGSIDLMRLAGLKPAAVICELMNSDGTMMHGNQITQFAKINKINSISIDDLINYKLLHENLIEEQAETLLPLEQYGLFKLTIVKEKFNNKEHIILSNEPTNPNIPQLVRIHSSCITGDLFGSMRCDCKAQLHYSLKRIAAEGGMLFYLDQEGRGIGLLNKIKAYSLQEKGFDTIDANTELNLPIDSRKYYMVANILRIKQIENFRLLTNNPLKSENLRKYGYDNLIAEAMPTFSNACNKKYLQTKRNKLKHFIDI